MTPEDLARLQEARKIVAAWYEPMSLLVPDAHLERLEHDITAALKAAADASWNEACETIGSVLDIAADHASQFSMAEVHRAGAKIARTLTRPQEPDDGSGNAG